MKNSQFEAKTFGVGELISQRKLFRVPPHQRSYAWDKDAVDEFIGDIETALGNGASDYFIGLIVIQASPSGEWVLLDGQQRLTTVSLIYAAARLWLLDNGYDADAHQIHHEYLGVRRLGGDYSSRMLLNGENQDLFEGAVTQAVGDSQFRRFAQVLPRTASNKLLLSAALNCRKWIKLFAGENEAGDGGSDRVSKIYGLARFLDSRLKVVAVEVSSDVDAYVLFESLNDRGIALSALDLIKNYILSLAPDQVDVWAGLLMTLGDENPEDFLKVFWTSRYGVIQKSQIFRGVKTQYPSAIGVITLLDQLKTDAEILAALSDDDHPYWEKFKAGIRDQIFLLRSLDSKQARPLLISILRDLEDQDLISSLVWGVTVAIIRFQVVGKGRTGVVEKVFSRLCQIISAKEVMDQQRFRQEAKELLIDDRAFADAFKRHEDKKYSRIAYLLAADVAMQVVENDVLDASFIRSYYDACRVSQIFTSISPDHAEIITKIGNFHLVPTSKDPQVCLPGLTPEISSRDMTAFITARSELLADRALNIWSMGAYT